MLDETLIFYIIKVLPTGEIMKIDLDYPYSENWAHGYIQTNPEGRKTVILYNSNIDRSSTSYARYLMATSIGRYLGDNEHIDHIDNDKTNDVVGNLQILTPEENSKKEYLRKGRFQSMVVLKCPQCENEFERRRGLTQLVKCFKGRISCCSGKCSADFKRKKLSRADKDSISEDQVIGEFKMPCYRA